MRYQIPNDLLRLNKNFVSNTDYDKICLSLLSGLPNEQELALNVCTILSNEGNYMLHLEQTPRLVNLLLCQAGVWPAGDNALKEVYVQGWDGVKGRNMRRFWRSTLVVPYPKLLEQCDWEIGEQDEDEKLLNLEFDPGAFNIEGQRVLRVALILHNLSFEKNNVSVLVSNPNLLRFLLLGMHSSWADLKQTAYDTFSNIAVKIKVSIEKDATLRLVFQTLMDGIQSSDRFLVIKSMDILSQLCNCEQNEDIIPSQIDVEIYEQMVSFLTIHDIMLLFFTLEALYALSDLGRYACDKIVSVRRSIGALVSLLTWEPNQCSSAQIRVKVVETLVPAEPNPEPPEVPSSTPSTAATTATTATITTANEDSEAFVCNWLRQTYEYASGCSVARNDIYADYVAHCSQVGRRGVVNASTFASSVKSVFTQCGLKKVQSNTGVISFHHDGLQRKSSAPASPLHKTANSCASSLKKVPPAAVLNPLSTSPKQVQRATHSPILKAQLSAPPKPNITSPQVTHAIQPSTPVRKPPLSSSCYAPSNPPSLSPNNAGSSTLIKNLLANKVQQRQLHVQPSVHKMVIYTPEKPGVNRTINSAPTTFFRSIRPGTQSCISLPFTQSPIQSSIVTNRVRMVSASSPRILKSTPVLAAKIQTAVTNPVRPNGMIHDLPQMCTQPEEVKSLTDNNSKKSTHIKPVQNYISLEKTIVNSEDNIFSDAGIMKNSCYSSDNEKSSVLSLDDNAVNFTASTLPDFESSLMQPNSLNVSDLTGSSIALVPSDTTAVISSQNAVSPTMLLKSMLSNLNESDGPAEKTEILQSAPLLNGLFDKNKVQNGNNTDSEVISSQGKSTNVTTLSSTVVTTPFTSSGNSLMQICTGQTTFSGTIEMQPDQKGVVRLHIESPENSNQGSDLSSISDITRTLECASKAISRTNAECSSQLPSTCTYETSTVNTANATTLARTGQQFIVVAPALNQPQLLLQSPNIRFHILHSLPKVENAVDITGLPRVSLNQLSQIRQITAVAAPSVVTAALKRPSSDSQKPLACSDTKKLRLDTKISPLEASLRLPAPISSSVASNGVNKSPQDDHPSLPKSTSLMESLSPSKLPTAKAVAVPLQIADFPCEQEVKTFSGLSSAGNDTPSVVTTNQPSEPKASSSKLEYVCEWKDCYKKFSSPGAVLLHASKVHAPYCNDDMLCLWEGCDSMKRRRFSLLTHLQDWHCNEKILNIQAMRRKEMSQQGKTSIAAPERPPPHPGYAPDAAILAIKRHALQYLNHKELSEESALAKSFHLTSALILRNLVTHSPLARSYVRCYEPELAYLAMSPVEYSRTIAQCLSELSRSHD